MACGGSSPSLRIVVQVFNLHVQTESLHYNRRAGSSSVEESSAPNREAAGSIPARRAELIRMADKNVRPTRECREY